MIPFGNPCKSQKESTKTKSEIKLKKPEFEIINAVVGDVELYYAYDMPNHIDVFFKKEDGTHEKEGEYFAKFHYQFNENHDELHSKELNWGIAMSRFMDVLYNEFGWRFKNIIGTPMRLKIKRSKLLDGTIFIKVLSIGHITMDRWLNEF